jgi:hypothetical protein
LVAALILSIFVAYHLLRLERKVIDRPRASYELTREGVSLKGAFTKSQMDAANAGYQSYLHSQGGRTLEAPPSEAFATTETSTPFAATSDSQSATEAAPEPRGDLAERQSASSGEIEASVTGDSESSSRRSA